MCVCVCVCVCVRARAWLFLFLFCRLGFHWLCISRCTCIYTHKRRTYEELMLACWFTWHQANKHSHMYSTILSHTVYHKLFCWLHQFLWQEFLIWNLTQTSMPFWLFDHAWHTCSVPSVPPWHTFNLTCILCHFDTLILDLAHVLCYFVRQPFDTQNVSFWYTYFYCECRLPD